MSRHKAAAPNRTIPARGPTPGAIIQIMIYLDNAATSFPKPEAVYQALDRFARTTWPIRAGPGTRWPLAAERALDDCRHLLNQFFHGEGPERFIFTLNCTDALNMAFKGVLAEGDHVITTDLEHNSVSRPLRAMELAGKITLTRIAADKGGTDRSRRHPQGDHAEDAAHRPDAWQQRARHRAADRRDRPNRSRKKDLVPRRCRPDRGRDPDRHPGDVHRPARVSRATSRCSARPAPGPSTSARRPSSARGAKAAPAAIRPAKRSRASIPTSSKAARRTSSASPAWPPASSMSPSKASPRSISTKSNWSNACGNASTRSAATRSSAIAT